MQSHKMFTHHFLKNLKILLMYIEANGQNWITTMLRDPSVSNSNASCDLQVKPHVSDLCELLNEFMSFVFKSL